MMPRIEHCMRALALVLLISRTAGANDKGGWEETVNDEGKKVQTLKIEAPSMTEEDQYGYNMPDRYKCDSCRAVVHHLNEALRKQQPASRRLKSWEYFDLFEETCRSSFEGYGIKLVNGENVLSGPALKDNTELAPGMGAIQMGGETWKKRLAEICRKLVFEEVGEEETYEFLYGKFKASDEVDPKDFCLNEIRHCKPTRLGPEPPKPKEDTPKETKPKKEKKPKADKKSKADKGPEKSSKTAVKDSLDQMELQDFMQILAMKHGKKTDEYTKPRAEHDWEKLFVAVAGRIFNRQSDEL